MEARYTTIRIYLFVCRNYRGRLAAAVQRQSNNDQPDLTDEEVLTIYLFGLFKKLETVSDIYEYAEDHFSDWFPDLLSYQSYKSYQSYNRRLNRLSAAFALLVQKALQKIDGKRASKEIPRITDSMPIMVSRGPRASQVGGRFRTNCVLNEGTKSFRFQGASD
jgi:hypothetical protein